jgi:PEP-CTERM motif
MIKAAVILAAALAAIPAMAQTITFTIYADGSGTLVNGDTTTTFTDQTITFTQMTDITAIINPCTHGGSYNYPCAPDVATNTVTIGAMAPLTLTGPTYFFNNQESFIGIANAPFSVFLAIGDVSSYNMQTSFGPTSSGIYGVPFSGELTSGGLLSVNYAAGTQGTFEAVLGTPTTTPEPASFFLMGSGLLAMGGILRRRIFRR